MSRPTTTVIFRTRSDYPGQSLMPLESPKLAAAAKVSLDASTGGVEASDNNGYGYGWDTRMMDCVSTEALVKETAILSPVDEVRKAV